MDPAALSSLVPSSASSSALGQVKNVQVGSQGATVTLAGGREIGIDLGGVMGGRAGGGGSNVMGIGMLLFGLSVLTRLLSTIARIIGPRRAPRERWVTR